MVDTSSVGCLPYVYGSRLVLLMGYRRMEGIWWAKSCGGVGVLTAMETKCACLLVACRKIKITFKKNYRRQG